VLAVLEQLELVVRGPEQRQDSLNGALAASLRARTLDAGDGSAYRLAQLRDRLFDHALGLCNRRAPAMRPIGCATVGWFR
jgi:hypothetical protein